MAEIKLKVAKKILFIYQITFDTPDLSELRSVNPEQKLDGNCVSILDESDITI